MSSIKVPNMSTDNFQNVVIDFKRVLALLQNAETSVFIAHQVWTGIPPKVRKLASHIILYPQRIAKDSVGHIARGCLLSKGPT